MKFDKFAKSAILLSLIAGFTDAFVYQKAKVFSSFMTGNLMGLSIDIGLHQFQTGIYKLIALLSFVAGIVVTSVLLQSAPHSKKRLYGTGLFQLVLLFFLWTCEIAGVTLPIDVLVMISSFAMGIQGALTVRLGVSANTLALTKNIVTVVSGFTDEAVEARQGPKARQSGPVEQLAIILCYVAGALGASFFSAIAPWIGMAVCLIWAVYFYLAYWKHAEKAPAA